MIEAMIILSQMDYWPTASMCTAQKIITSQSVLIAPCTNFFGIIDIQLLY